MKMFWIPIGTTALLLLIMLIRRWTARAATKDILVTLEDSANIHILENAEVFGSVEAYPGDSIPTALKSKPKPAPKQD